MEELKQSLLLTMELEDTKLKAQHHLKSKDEQISHLKQLLTRAIKERDEAQDKCHKLLLQKGIDSTIVVNGFSSSDCDESIVSSPSNIPQFPEPDYPLHPNAPLPQKGKLLEAVIKAGPLLQTLLLAGPLPQWRHPPPPLDTTQIPPFPVPAEPDMSVEGCGKVNRKRGGLCEGQESPMKCHRILLH